MQCKSKLARMLARNGVPLALRIGIQEVAQRLRDTYWRHVFGVSRLRIGSGAKVRGLSGITIGNNLIVGRGLWLEAIHEYKGEFYKPKLVIGSDVSISDFTTIVASNSVDIRDGVLIASKVLITDHNHGRYSIGELAEHPLNISPANRPLFSLGKVYIGKNVWIGEGCTVLSGANIGDGAVIASGSVVSGYIPALSIAAGSPARIIRRYDEVTSKWVIA